MERPRIQVGTQSAPGGDAREHEGALGMKEDSIIGFTHLLWQLPLEQGEAGMQGEEVQMGALRRRRRHCNIKWRVRESSRAGWPWAGILKGNEICKGRMHAESSDESNEWAVPLGRIVDGAYWPGTTLVIRWPRFSHPRWDRAA